MKTIDDVLEQFAPRSAALGTRAGVDVEALRAATDAVRRENTRVFWAIFACVAALYAILIGFLVRWSSQPTVAAAAIGASGVSLPFLLRYMMALWRSKVRADAVMVFAAALEPATLRAVLRAMQESGKEIPVR
ncbi:MAG: hypothetical protein JO061_11310, partial [Acidobacteriaceae bacterium]|nr:hypothetical protein [Acidobacteriaceae bacterium]